MNGRTVRRGLQAVRADLGAERDRIAAMLERAALPGPLQAAPVAVARGAMLLDREIAMVPGSGERLRVVGEFWRTACALEVMCRRAAGAAAPAPFTPGQVAVAARYRALAERVAAAGVRCASVEARSAGGGGGDGTGFIDVWMDMAADVRRMQQRIGTIEALSVRRVRPSHRGGRRSVTARELVDSVVLRGWTLSRVLRAAGWAAKGAHRELLRAALAAALDRMQGLPSPRPQDEG